MKFEQRLSKEISDNAMQNLTHYILPDPYETQTKTY